MDGDDDKNVDADAWSSARTRAGARVRILCADAPGIYCLVGLIEGRAGAFRWDVDGRLGLEPSRDDIAVFSAK